MCEIPTSVDDAEKVVRIVGRSYLNKSQTKLKPRIFRSQPGTDEVSVIRHTYRDANFCKAKARERAAAPEFEYVGLAVLAVRQIRMTGSTVHDSREVYCGHAHISHGIPAATPNEPLSPSQNLALDQRVEALCSIARYYPDPDLNAEVWTGTQQL